MNVPYKVYSGGTIEESIWSELAGKIQMVYFNFIDSFLEYSLLYQLLRDLSSENQRYKFITIINIT